MADGLALEDLPDSAGLGLGHAHGLLAHVGRACAGSVSAYAFDNARATSPTGQGWWSR